jgi:hypothetical protein
MPVVLHIQPAVPRDRLIDVDGALVGCFFFFLLTIRFIGVRPRRRTDESSLIDTYCTCCNINIVLSLNRRTIITARTRRRLRERFIMLLYTRGRARDILKRTYILLNSVRALMRRTPTYECCYWTVGKSFTEDGTGSIEVPEENIVAFC